MQSRSYNQFCGLAYALDIVGERWTLLIIRELVAGPRRFTDLLAGLPGISTNLLSERLKTLEQHNLIGRRVLPPPAGSAVYELSALGGALEPALLALGKWGSQFIPPAPADAVVLHLGSYALTPKTFFRPELAAGLDETYELHIGGEIQQLHVVDGRLDVRQGAARTADLIMYADVPAYLGLLAGELRPAEALASGTIRIAGDLATLERFLRICGIPDGQSAPA